MDGEDEKGSVVERWVMAKKFTLRFVAAVSFFSLLYSYFSGLWSYNIQCSTLIFSLFAHSLDRKYVFLICNGIVAFLVNNLTFSSSSSSSSSASGFIKSAEDSVNDVSAVLVQENADSSSVQYGEEEEEERGEMEAEDEDEDEVGENIGEEKETNVEVKEAEDELDEDEEEEVVEKENKGRGEEVLARVSTEELNNKFEEFIRKMKEEIRIEAQQQQQLVAAV